MGAATGCAFCKDKTPVLDVNDKVNFLKAVKLFKNLSEAELQILADASSTQRYPKGTIIYHQGDYGAELFIIASGRVAVSFDGTQTAYELSDGDHFGENALLRDCPRTVTVTTTLTTQVVKVMRKQFQDMDLQKKLIFKSQRRKAALGHAPEHTVKTQPPSPKSEEDVEVILNAIRSNTNLTNIVQMDDEQCQLLCDAAWEQKVATDECVIKQGSTEADYFYIVKEGSLIIEIDVPDDEVACEDTICHHHVQQVGVKEKGGCFGELALLLNSPRAATVRALEPSTVWVVDRNTFKRGCARKADHYAKIYAKYLETSPFTALTKEERLVVAKALLESNFSKGENIFAQGEEGKAFYILYEGEVTVSVDGVELQRLTGTNEKVEIFGELALINGDTYAATVTVVSKTAKTLAMDEDSFEMLLGPIAALADRGKGDRLSPKASKMEDSSYALALKSHKRRTATADESCSRIYYEDLEVIGLLGCGGFGVVDLVQHKTTKNAYALKSLSKGVIVQNHQQQEVMMEKKIQMKCDSDFIVRLYETYNGTQYLYLLLELGLGGELCHTYRDKNLFGSVKHARFYTAGVVFAFRHMHRKKMIYRDLKPENILFNNKGHTKLTDMGLATICVGKTFTTCGTAPYMAPEVILSTGHNHAVDWWTLGIFTYELMTGHTPFEAASQALIFAKIQRGISQVRFPQETFGPLRTYIRHMCDPDPAERLAMKKGDADNIEKHPWYEGFDWKAMKSLKVPPPYVPQVASNTDMENFRSKDEIRPEFADYVDDESGWDEDFATCEFSRADEERNNA